jgi:HSF-type DNA-binding
VVAVVFVYALTLLCPFVTYTPPLQIIPSYYRHKKIGSFKRQLGLYGFKRVSEGPHTGEYYHDFFRKGQPDLCKRIKRTPKSATTSTSNGGGGEGSSD